MESIENVLEKIKIARKEKGYSHENIANELGISQAAYSNIEKNNAKLTVERLIELSEILRKPIYYFFEVSPHKVYNQNISDNSYGHIDNLYQDNKLFYQKLEDSYDRTISVMQAEINYLRKTIESLCKK